MSRELEDRLIAELDAVGAALGVPRVDLAGVRRSVRRERRRRVGLGAGAASLVVVVALVGALWLLPGSTGSRAVNPAGSVDSATDGLGVPWVDVDDVVHLPSGAEVSLPGVSGVFSRGGTTVAVVGGQLTRLEADGAQSVLGGAPGNDVGRPVISDDGRWIAWLSSGRARDANVIRHEIGSDVTSGIGVEEPVGLADVGDDGSVLLSPGSGDRLEQISTCPVRSTPVTCDLGAFALTGPVVTSGVLLPDGRLAGYSADGTTTVYRIGRSGELTAEGTLPGQAGLSFAPDASAYVRADGGSLVLQQLDADLNPTTSTSLGLGSAEWGPVGWTDSGDLVLVTQISDAIHPIPPPDVRRCTRAGACTAVDLQGLAYVATS